MISNPLLKFLKFCFFCNILIFVTAITGMVLEGLDKEFISSRENTILMLIHSFFGIFAVFLWFYCFYFFYKYDRYSKVVIKLFILNLGYAPYYFYNVIWKQKRSLENKIDYEPVLGNTIHLESEEESDDKS